MMFLLFARRAAICCCGSLLLLLPAVVGAQTNYYAKNGTEYAIVGSMPGDQVMPDVAITPAGGFVVWQDNVTDGSGFGISARRVDGTLSGTLSAFRVNQQGTNDQENPRVALLKNGGAVFVWQGGQMGNQHIFARFLTPTNTFLTTTDLAVSTFPNNFQINPAVTTLNNSNVVVVWASFDQVNSNSLQDVYCKILSPTGQTISDQFLVNQFTSFNQRTPAVAALKNGGFVVAWVSEQERNLASVSGATNSAAALAALAPSVDIYARLYASNGVPASGEILVNTDSNPCANPAVAAATDGSFLVAWDAHDFVNTTNSLDVFARPFSSSGVGGTTLRVNSHLQGDQYAPRLSAIGTDYLMVWTSLGQDGSREGVFGQFVHNNGSPVGGEFQVNTTTVSRQIQPVVTADGAGQFLVAWSSYVGLPNSFDLFAQRYLNVAALLSPMAAPFVYAPFTLSNGVYQPQLQVSWPSLAQQGLPVASYLIYVDGAATNLATTTTNIWTMTAANGLATNSTHSFQVNYVTTQGLSPAISGSTSGTTWSGLSWGGVPYEWMAQFFGGYYGGAYHTNGWSSPNLPPPNSPFGSPTLLQLFLTGGIPYDSTTWLVTSLVPTSQGTYLLYWNPQPGLTYQVQSSPNLVTWTNLGAARFAAGATDSIYVGGSAAGYYRVLLLRQ